MPVAARRLSLLAVLGLGLVVASTFVWVDLAQGATFVVANTNASGPGSLRQAILDANANAGADIVEVPAGAYDIDNLIGITDDVTISGAGAASTIITGDDTHMLFIISAGANVTFEGVTLQRGRAIATNSGGAIQAISVGSLTIRDSIVQNNSSAWLGGGVYASGGPVTIEQSTFAGNAAPSGGGVFLFNNVVSITDTTFDDNTSIHPSDPTTGAALTLAQTTATINRSTFSDNRAGTGAGDDGTGSGIYATMGATVTVTNSTVSGNTAYARGGGVVSRDGSVVTLRHSTVALNVGVDGGGGLFADEGTIQLVNTLVYNNQSTPGPSNCEVASGSITSAGGNLSDDSTCTGLTEPSDLNNNGGTTLGVLADNSGTTFTHALSAGSSAIDAATCIQGTTEDQRTVTRPQGASCDIGAYEFEGSTNPTSPSTAPASTTPASTTPASTTPASTTPASTSTPGGSTTTIGSATTTIAAGGATTTTTEVFIWVTLPPTGSSASGTTPLLAGVLFAVGVAVVLVTRRRQVPSS